MKPLFKDTSFVYEGTAVVCGLILKHTSEGLTIFVTPLPYVDILLTVYCCRGQCYGTYTMIELLSLIFLVWFINCEVDKTK